MAATVAIIGVTGFGSVHYRDLMREVDAGTMRVIAATVINPEAAASQCARLRELGCAIYDDHLEMLRRHGDELDLCFIPTGIHLHAPMAIAAMRHGANVYVEKPVAATVQDVAAMRAAELETGRWCAVGFNLMYTAQVHEIKRAILGGRIGRLRALAGWGLWPRPESYYLRNGWAGRLRVGETWVLDSPFNNALSHQLNLLAFFAGTRFERSAEIVEVQAELYRAKPIESPDTACIRATSADGISAVFVVTHACVEQAGPQIVIHGDAGRIDWDASGIWIENSGGEREQIGKAERGEDPRACIARQLLRRLEDPEAFVCDLAISGTHTLIVNAAHDSSPVQQVPSRLVTAQPLKESTNVVISGIEGLVRRAAAEGKLFSELGDVDWAQPGARIDAREYHRFPGGALVVSD